MEKTIQLSQETSERYIDAIDKAIEYIINTSPYENSTEGLEICYGLQMMKYELI